ncbi:hypothetical protein F0562_007115 [Nyssa sinensis]|uniref:Exostosin GT47 domain-containing protein n=1 Tax=Nyssa sinensis TaxID=561372 RepID=A0A5J5A481_9ASTE|nr:hypothetical protein F0562_007115 [Nyssa sinensis]
MDHGFRFISQTETKRLLWLLGITFILVMGVQYFELPYSSFIPFLQKSSSLTGGSSYNSEIVGNTTPLNALNSTYPVQETTDNTTTYALKKETNHGNEGKDGLKNDLLLERNGSSNGAFGLIRNGTSFDNLVSTNNNDSSSVDIQKEDISLSSEKNASLGSGHESPLFALPPKMSLPSMNSPTNLDANSGTPLMSVNPNISSVHKGVTDTLKKPGPQQSNLTLSSSNSSMTDFSAVRQNSKTPPTPVMSISKMNDLLLQSHSSPHSVEALWSSTVDQELLYAKSQIENAPTIRNDTALYAPLYRNVSMFKRSYELMENMLKVYIYKEGEKPIFHQSILEGIYAAEGWFLKLLEANKQFVTENPIKAHLFYLPFSSRLLELTLYVRHSHSRDNLIQYMKNYVDMLAAKYPFWNRTDGADHFVTACHDWAPAETRGRMVNCLRALCNADIRTGFDIGKDVSIPTTVHAWLCPANSIKVLGKQRS